MELATVKPISKKAKNRFANLMGSDAQCIIEQHTGTQVFLYLCQRTQSLLGNT